MFFFFLPFSLFSLIHTPGVYIDHPDYIRVTIHILICTLFWAENGSQIPFKHISGSFPPCTLVPRYKGLSLFTELGCVPLFFFPGLGFFSQAPLSCPGRPSFVSTGPDKRAVLHSVDHAQIQILRFSVVEFAMNERFMSLNSRSLSMNDVFGLGYR